MPTWTENVSRSTNDIIKRFAGRAHKVRGYTGYNRWIRETPELPRHLNVQQVGEAYGTRNVINTSKKGLAHNKAIFQLYSDFLRRKNSRQTNVQDLAAFVAIVVLTQIPITCEASTPSKPAPTPAPTPPPTPTPTPAPSPPSSVGTTTAASLGEGTGLDDWENGDW